MFRTKAPLFCEEVFKSKNFINIKGEHSKIGMAINGEDVVFLATKMIKKGSWYFCNNNDKIIQEAKQQIEALVNHEDWFPIVE